MLLAVIVCSLSAWSQPQLLRLAGELLEHFDDVSKVEKTFEDNGLSVAVVIFNIDLDSDYYNTLNDQLAEYGFALIEDDGNELIYRNEKQIQCNIMFPKNGKARIYVVQRTNRVW